MNYICIVNPLTSILCLLTAIFLPLKLREPEEPIFPVNSTLLILNICNLVLYIVITCFFIPKAQKDLAELKSQTFTLKQNTSSVDYSRGTECIQLIEYFDTYNWIIISLNILLVAVYTYYWIYQGVSSVEQEIEEQKIEKQEIGGATIEDIQKTLKDITDKKQNVIKQIQQETEQHEKNKGELLEVERSIQLIDDLEEAQLTDVQKQDALFQKLRYKQRKKELELDLKQKEQVIEDKKKEILQFDTQIKDRESDYRRQHLIGKANELTVKINEINTADGSYLVKDTEILPQVMEHIVKSLYVDSIISRYAIYYTKEGQLKEGAARASTEEHVTNKHIMTELQIKSDMQSYIGEEVTKLLTKNRLLIVEPQVLKPIIKQYTKGLTQK